MRTTTLTPELASSRAAGAALERVARIHEHPIPVAGFVYDDPEAEDTDGRGCVASPLDRAAAELIAGPPGSSFRRSVRELLAIPTTWGRVFMVRDHALTGSGSRLRGATKGEVLAYLFAVNTGEPGERPGDFRIVRSGLSGLTVALPDLECGMREDA